MSWIATAIVGSAAIGGTASYFGQKDASKEAARATKDGAALAAEAQLEATKLSIDEQKRQFDEIQKLLAPYVSAGTSSLTQMLNLTGLGGPAKQDEAIKAIEASPQYTSLVKAGEEAILQNASATGGLRGGNVQRALEEFRPSVLSQLIESQYSKLSSIAGMGQASAAGVASAGQTTASNISNLLQSAGASQANAYLTSANASAQAALASGAALTNAVSGVTGSVPLAIYAAKKF